MFWLKMISGNHFTPAYVFSKHRKLGQTEINFYVDCKITLITRKTTSSFILPSNDLHFSHTLSKLLIRTPHRHHRYSPSSIMSTFSLTPNIGLPFPSRQFELHPQSNERRQSTHGEFPPLFEFISIQQPHLTSDPPSISVQQPHPTSPPIHPLF